MSKIRIVIPALDYLLERPEILNPPPGDKECVYSKLCIPEEYLVHLAKMCPSSGSNEEYDAMAGKLIEIMRRKKQTNGLMLSNGVWAEVMETCASQEEVKQTEAIYLPLKLYQRLHEHGTPNNAIAIFTFSREVDLLASYHEVNCYCFASPAVSKGADQSSIFDLPQLRQTTLRQAKPVDEQTLADLRSGNAEFELFLEQADCDSLASVIGKRGYIEVKVPNYEASILMRFYSWNKEMGQLQSLRHNLPNWLLAGLPGSPNSKWQQALSDAILLPPEDVRVVICTGPTNTGKTLTALATLIEGVPARFSVPNDQRRRKIIFPYRLFRAEDYAQGYKWEDGLPLAPSSPACGWDTSPDLRMVAFGNWLTDAWLELAYLADRGEPSGLVSFLSKKCEFCPLDSLIYRHVSDAYIFLDNFQNYTADEARRLLGTAGRNSKLIILGDIEQVTRPECTREDNGLSYVLQELVGKHSEVAYVCLAPEDRPYSAQQPLL